MQVRVYIVAALVGMFGVVAIIGWHSGAAISGTVPHSKSVNYALSVLPMFILIGFIAYHAGLTHALFRAARAWVGWVPGGLAVASVFAASIRRAGAASLVNRIAASASAMASRTAPSVSVASAFSRTGAVTTKTR